MVQMIIVSMKTESIWTRPCLTGWETEAEAAALGAEPTPASFEYKPRLIPSMTAEPAKPEKIALKSKALAKIDSNIVGMLRQFNAMTTMPTLR